MRFTGVAAVFAALALCTGIGAADDAVPARFAPLSFLLGSWAGSGTSDAGAGTGSDVFSLDLEGNVLLRRAHAEYPAAAGKPAVTYVSLMVVYKEPAHPELRADYFDNGHVIHYSLVPTTELLVARFVSDAAPGVPVFRLTYTGSGDGKTLRVKFEIQPPGAPGFSTLAEGVDTRTAAKP